MKSEAGRVRGWRPWLRRAQLVGAAIMLGSLVLVLVGQRSATSLTSGPVTLATIGTVTAGTPYSSGQGITVEIAANTTLSLSNLQASGFSGEPSMKAMECADPGGTVANLPTTPTGNCDGQTVVPTSAVNADGSFNLPDTIYALPDGPTFGESASQTPVCGIGADECVLYVGPAQQDFSKPHLFSAPFSVLANSDDGGENPGDGSALAQTGVSATNSSVVATPQTAVADGSNAAKVTVTLKDTNGAPVTGGKQVTLSQVGSGHSVIMLGGTAMSTGTTDPTTGAISFTVSDTSVETVTYSATDDTDSNLLLTPAVAPTVQFVAPVVTPANSTITAVPTAVPSGTSSSITVTLNDQAVPPQPVVGKSVTLTQGSGGSTITVVSGTTNAQGQATFTVADTSTEDVTYSATDTTDSIPLSGVSVTVQFGTLVVSATASTVTADPGVVSSASNGGVLPTGLITVTLLAADGHSVVSGKTVTLSASSTNAQIAAGATPDVTDSSGKATFTVSDATAETVTFTAKDVTDGVTIAETAPVQFVTPAVSASTSTVTTTTPLEPADGETPASIVVTVRDQFGHAVAGVAVTVSGNPSASTRVAPQQESTSVPAGTTGADGTALFFVNDTTAETVTYSAMDTTDSVAITQTASVTFDATAPQASNSAISASPTTVPADGSTSSKVTVTLQDHNNNPVPGRKIALAAAGGSSVITAISGTTNAQGQATFSVTDTTTEVVTYTATDTTDSLALAGQSVKVTFGNPQATEPAAADSTIVAQPASVPADGATAATITVVLADANGDPVPGKTVTISAGSGKSTINTVSGVTNADGQATYTVTDGTVESVTYSATDTTDNLAISGQSVSVSFTAPTTTSSTTSTTSSTTSTTSSSSSSASTAPSPPAAPAGAASSQSASSSSSTGTASATAGGITVTGSGVGALTVAKYSSAPDAGLIDAAGDYFDVKVAGSSSFSSVTIKFTEPTGGTGLDWWNGSSWTAVSPAPVVTGTPPSATVTLSSSSSPTIADLSGTVFGVVTGSSATSPTGTSTAASADSGTTATTSSTSGSTGSSAASGGSGPPEATATGATYAQTGLAFTGAPSSFRWLLLLGGLMLALGTIGRVRVAPAASRPGGDDGDG